MTTNELNDPSNEQQLELAQDINQPQIDNIIEMIQVDDEEQNNDTETSHIF